MGKSYKDNNKRNSWEFDKRSKRFKQEKNKHKLTNQDYSDYGPSKKTYSWDEEGY